MLVRDVFRHAQLRRSPLRRGCGRGSCKWGWLMCPPATLHARQQHSGTHPTDSSLTNQQQLSHSHSHPQPPLMPFPPSQPRDDPHRMFRPSPPPASPFASRFVTGAIVLGLVAGGYWIYTKKKERGFPTEVMLQLRQAKAYEVIAEKSIDYSHEHSLDTLPVYQSSLKSAEDMYKRVLEQLNYQPPREPKSEQDIAAIDAKLHSKLYDHKTMELPNLFGIDPSLIPHVLVRLAHVLHKQGKQRYKEAEDTYIQALILLRQTKGLFSAQLLTACRQLGWLYADMGRLRDAEIVLMRCMQIATELRRHPPDPAPDWDAESDSAFSLAALKNWRPKPRPPSPELYSDEVLSEICEQLAYIYRNTHQEELAMNWSREALDLLDKTLTDPNAPNFQPCLLPRLARAVHLLTGLTHDYYKLNKMDLAYQSGVYALQSLQLLVNKINADPALAPASGAEAAQMLDTAAIAVEADHHITASFVEHERNKRAKGGWREEKGPRAPKTEQPEQQPAASSTTGTAAISWDQHRAFVDAPIEVPRYIPPSTISTVASSFALSPSPHDLSVHELAQNATAAYYNMGLLLKRKAGKDHNTQRREDAKQMLDHAKRLAALATLEQEASMIDRDLQELQG